MSEDDWNAVRFFLEEHGFTVLEIDPARLELVVKIGEVRDDDTLGN